MLALALIHDVGPVEQSDECFHVAEKITGVGEVNAVPDRFFVEALLALRYSHGVPARGSNNTARTPRISFMSLPPSFTYQIAVDGLVSVHSYRPPVTSEN